MLKHKTARSFDYFEKFVNTFPYFFLLMLATIFRPTKTTQLLQTIFGKIIFVMQHFGISKTAVFHEHNNVMSVELPTVCITYIFATETSRSLPLNVHVPEM